MRRSAAALLLLLGAACTGDELVQVGATDPGDPSSTSASETTGAPECFGDDGCQPSANPCEPAFCHKGACVPMLAPEGTPLLEQVPGDCAFLVCDGAGGVAAIADPLDNEDDGIVCTLDVCSGTTPVHLPGMTACYSGPPETLGVGQCKAGVQMCDADGPRGECVGEVVPAPEECDATLLDEDCDEAINESGDLCVCKPASWEPCYTGPPGTEDVGVCRGGLRQCDGEGLGYGGCAEQVVPTDEECDALDLDEDCDGLVNESGASCACGDGDLSLGEVCDDGNTDDQDLCAADCSAVAELVDVAVGFTHACAIAAGGAIKCWGDNSSGQLGLGDQADRGDEPGEMGPALPVVDLGSGAAAQAIAVGWHHGCALVVGGEVKCWGEGSRGQLGLGDTKDRGDEPGEMGDALPFVALAGPAIFVGAGEDHSCALLDDGRAQCWGRNAQGQLGLGDTNDRGDDPGEMGDALPFVDLAGDEAIVQLSVGRRHNCALLSGGGVQCWGSNSAGELGLGDSDDRGDGPGEMGDALPFVDLAPTLPAAVSAGDARTCARMDDQSVRCWGHYLGLGLGLAQGDNRGDEPGEMGAALPAVDVGAPALAIASSGGRACVLADGGAIKCWGANKSGELGLGDVEARGDDPGEMGAALPFVDLGAGVVVVQIASGVASTCARLDDGHLKCWGSNDMGNLGLGDTERRGDQPGEMGDALPRVPVL